MGGKIMKICISIHAPHEGERRRAGLGGSKSMGISIHAPHEGERPANGAYDAIARDKFQSTLPTRGSDFLLRARANGCLSFNPRSPRGGATVS